MDRIFKVLFAVFSLVFLFYLYLPNPKFPNPPEGALQSNEPADRETPLRRAYFTNLTREEVVNFYKKEFENPASFGIPFFTERLNYPPEEAQTLIRDQTKSTFLEELVHPFRESLFVNGFEPKDAKDAVFVEGTPWRQKIIIRYVPSNTAVRLVFGLLTIVSIYLVAREYSKFLS